jgi:hypothetical protein
LEIKKNEGISNTSNIISDAAIVGTERGKFFLLKKKAKF